MLPFPAAIIGGTDRYLLFGAEIGDSTLLHGHIAITMFARTSDVLSGACQVQQSGVNHVATGVSNITWSACAPAYYCLLSLSLCALIDRADLTLFHLFV